MSTIETAPDGAAYVERLVSVDLWVFENRRAHSVWCSGSPKLRCADDFTKWIRRHEARLTERGAMLRLGNARRLVEPAFRPLLLAILAEERDAATHNKERQRKRG
jgi:hypothetical protein